MLSDTSDKYATGLQESAIPPPYQDQVRVLGLVAWKQLEEGSTEALVGPSHGNENQPPLVNHNLKPDWKAQPTPLDPRHHAVIDELPFKSPSPESWYCHPISTQSITSTDSRATSPIPSSTNRRALKKSTGSMEYLALDLQPGSPSPHHKPSTSSVTWDKKTDYVQVDKEKTRALQKTMQEWEGGQQSTCLPSCDAGEALNLRAVRQLLRAGSLSLPSPPP
ncbi:GRB2-associated-binding protein 2 [Microtus ochrogaster]|uniref:GRB2-associated-binding protein 2 n=1 Tax=Microtus ochrogaster TaxID=79684 RepID=A0A8J6G6N7_MICOH|nr:GRB2-associated-binding protein 2 [Microtus ochrogaster]